MLKLAVETLFLVGLTFTIGCFVGWLLRPLLIRSYPGLALTPGQRNPVERLIDAINAPFAPLFADSATTNQTVIPLGYRGTSWFDGYFKGSD